MASSHPQSSCSGQEQGAPHQYLLQRIRLRGLRRLVLPEETASREGTRAEALWPPSVPSPPEQVVREEFPTRRTDRFAGTGLWMRADRFKKKKREERALTLLKFRTNICSGAQTWAVGVEGKAGVIQTAGPGAVPGLWTESGSDLGLDSRAFPHP